jgi:hypothetical protein
MIYKLSLVS